MFDSMSSVLNCTNHPLRIPNIVDSDGAYLFDDQGKRYVDLESGVWCTHLGHKNGRVNAAIAQQDEPNLTPSENLLDHIRTALRSSLDTFSNRYTSDTL